MKVSVIIPLYNQLPFTKLCVEYLAKHTPPDLYEAVLVDNASSDGTPAFLSRLVGSVKKITNAENLGFAKACNQGARAAAGEYLLFLNNDTAPKAGWLQALLAPLEADPGVGVAGAKLLYPDGCVQHAGVAFAFGKLPYHIYMGLPGDHPAVNRAREFEAVTGACLLIRRELFFRLGGFDEAYVNGLEDVDLCLKVRKAGARIAYAPRSEVMHFESRSDRRQDRMDQNRKLFLGRWGDTLVQDDIARLREDGMSLRVVGGQYLFHRREEEPGLVGPGLAEARHRLAGGDIAGAFEAASKLWVTFPYNADVMEIMAEALLARGDAAKARLPVLAGLAMDPASPRLRALLPRLPGATAAAAPRAP